MHDAEARQLMETLLQQMDDLCPAALRPTPFWAHALTRLLPELRTHGFERFRALEACRTLFVPSWGPPGNGLTGEVIASMLAHLESLGVAAGSVPWRHVQLGLTGRSWAREDWRVFRAGRSAGLGLDLDLADESDAGAPPDLEAFEGRRYSRSMLNYLHGLVFLQQELGDVPLRRVVEVGGGFGTLGQILHRCGGGAWSWVNVDIPPTVVAAAWFLRQMPGLTVHHPLEAPQEGPIAWPAPGTQRLLCPWQMERLEGPTDLAWNFISFQEMEPATVAFYAGQIERLGTRWVLLRNLREGKPKRSAARPFGVDQPLLGEDYDTLFPAFRLRATQVHPFGYETVDGFHSELRLYERVEGAGSRS
jgi:putative sugar O-methyltransferase